MKPILFSPPESPYLVPHDGTFRVSKAETDPGDRSPGKKENRAALDAAVEELDNLQRVLYADDRYSVLLVFQAMDAAGKDGTIRAVLSGVNPAGCQVSSFKAPGPEALDHDFLWRINERLPERGRIGIFNRSHYEEVLVVRVHPEYLGNQRLPRRPTDLNDLWEERYQSIRDFERHLARNGTVILKFWLNVSKKEQRKRFVARIDEDQSNWKFSSADIAERGRWDEYMDAYEHMLNATSTPWAPWYAIPADSKSFMRRTVADIVVQTMKSLPLQYPKLPERERARMIEARASLEAE